MNVGDYVRTKKGTITEYNAHDILLNEFENRYYYTYDTYDEDNVSELVIESNPRIIKLIQQGDYVNGYKVFNIETSYILDENHNRIGEKIRLDIGNDMYGYTIYIEEKDIKSIVTREQFLQMEYKIESEVN